MVSEVGDLLKLLVTVEFRRSGEQGSEMCKRLYEVLAADDVLLARKRLDPAVSYENIGQVLAKDDESFARASGYRCE